MLKSSDQIFHHQNILSNGKKPDLLASWIILFYSYININYLQEEMKKIAKVIFIRISKRQLNRVLKIKFFKSAIAQLALE